MNTEIVPSPDTAPVQASLLQLLAPFTGYRYSFLLALIKDPARSHADVCRELGIEPQTAWNWHSMVPGFKQALDAIKEGRPQLRQEYARLAFEGAIPDLVDTMIAVGKNPTAKDGQRARERILETRGVLPKDAAVATGPITFTVVYYTTDAEGKRTIVPSVVEGEVRELPPGRPKVLDSSVLGST